MLLSETVCSRCAHSWLRHNIDNLQPYIEVPSHGPSKTPRGSCGRKPRTKLLYGPVVGVVTRVVEDAARWERHCRHQCTTVLEMDDFVTER